MYRECHSLCDSFPFLLICYCLLSFCVAKLEELGQNGNDIYCCKLFVIQSSRTLQSLLVSSFRQTYHVAAFSSCSVCIPCEEASTSTVHNIHCIVFPTVNSGTLTQESQFPWYLQVAETYMYFVWPFIAFQN